MSAPPLTVVAESEDTADDGFCVLYRRYHPRVRGLAARRFPAFDADDVAQETMVRVLLHAHRLDPQRDPWPYIAAIAVNVARDFGRARLPEVALTEDAYEREVAPAADEPVLSAERSASVRKVLDDLAPGSRQVLALHAYDEMSVGEIARFLGTNDNAVRQKLFRARRQFRRALAGVHSGSFGIGALVFAFRRRVAAANLAGGTGLSVTGAAVLAAAVAGVVTVGVTGGPGPSRQARPAHPAAADGSRAGTGALPETPDKARAGAKAAAPTRAVPPRAPDTTRGGDVVPPAGPHVHVEKPGNPFKPGRTDRTDVRIPTPYGDVVFRTEGEADVVQGWACEYVEISRFCR